MEARVQDAGSETRGTNVGHASASWEAKHEVGTCEGQDEASDDEDRVEVIGAKDLFADPEAGCWSWR